MYFIPVIIVPPMSQTLLEKIGMGFRKSNYYYILEKVIQDKIQIIDYSKNSTFCNPRLYGWPGFLIEEAAKEFTKDVIKKIAVG